MNALERVRLTPLMERTSGRPEIVIALIDGPVLMQNAALWSKNVRQVDSKLPATCRRASSAACMHGTFVASILAAKRGSGAPAICPDCTLLVRPIFSESDPHNGQMPSAAPDELAEAIVDAVKGGASVLNLSVSLAESSAPGNRQLEQALNYAAARDVLIVVAAGNQGMIGGSVLTSHPWTIPVIACDDSGRPLASSSLSASTGQRGLSAPGENVPVIGSNAAISRISGTSAAAPFVAGTAALLRSAFSRATAAAIKVALTDKRMGQRRRLIPPLLDAWAAYQVLAGTA
jgi:subtilisin family serine protease